MDGLLVIDKPRGLTSFGVVNKVRGVVRRLTGKKKPKVGHVGTLDPFATGVLPLCIGRTTRFARFLIEGDKRYRATMRLGQVTETDDTEGDVVEQSEGWRDLDEAAIRAALEGLVGEHMQQPPIYSAIRVGGKRAYALARAGQVPELAPRPIKIYSVEVGKIALPDVAFTVSSSKGTYIRAICRDIGASLGVGGHCHALRRLAAAGFEEEDCAPLEEMLSADEGQIRARLLSPTEMLRALPLVTVSEAHALRIRQGQRAPAAQDVPRDVLLRVVTEGGGLVCVAKVGEDSIIKPERVMV